MTRVREPDERVQAAIGLFHERIWPLTYPRQPFDARDMLVAHYREIAAGNTAPYELYVGEYLGKLSIRLQKLCSDINTARRRSDGELLPPLATSVPLGATVLPTALMGDILATVLPFEQTQRIVTFDRQQVKNIRGGRTGWLHLGIPKHGLAAGTAAAHSRRITSEAELHALLSQPEPTATTLRNMFAEAAGANAPEIFTEMLGELVLDGIVRPQITEELDMVGGLRFK